MADNLERRDDSVTPRDASRPEQDASGGPTGATVGGLSGVAAGAAIGAATAGPVGAVVGAAGGALVGALGGAALEGAINPAAEDEYWRENYLNRPYAAADRSYEHYRPAYRYGWESRARHAGRQWEDVETDLERGWDQYRGDSPLAWTDARQATRDAWHRVERAIPGDADRDGR